jgi:hypothetical protein
MAKRLTVLELLLCLLCIPLAQANVPELDRLNAQAKQARLHAKYADALRYWEEGLASARELENQLGLTR